MHHNPKPSISSQTAAPFSLPALDALRNGTLTLLHGHCLDVLRTLPANTIHCCVTSPPYWGLRDYGLSPSVWGGTPGCSHVWTATTLPASSGTISHGIRGETANPHSATRKPRVSEQCARCGAWRGCLGLEPTPELYVEHLVEVFAEVKRVLRPDGTLWLNLGDCHAGSWGNYRARATLHPPEGHKRSPKSLNASYPGPAFLSPAAHAPGLKPKDLVGIPWLVAFALRQDGWYLRSDIIWHKRNSMPESVRDRPTRAHEYLFLLSKSRRYFYDQDAIREPHRAKSLDRWKSGSTWNGERRRGFPGAAQHTMNPHQMCHPLGRNKRSVWTVATKPYKGPHFATFPPDLIRPCIRAGSPRGGIVLDPFAGTGTTGQVCLEEGRQFVGIELKAEYLALARERLKKVEETRSVTRGDAG